MYIPNGHIYTGACTYTYLHMLVQPLVAGFTCQLLQLAKRLATSPGAPSGAFRPKSGCQGPLLGG